MKANPLEIAPHGRKSGLRRLTWKAQKEQHRRTVERVPEVVIKVQGGGKTVADVRRYMKYISRDGMLLAVDDQGEKIAGKEAVKNLQDKWDMDMGRGQGKLHQSFNLVLSMPADTNPDKLFVAVQRWAAEQLPNHEYMMVLHTHETDPDPNPPKHPHVHIALKAEDRDGKRIHIRKATINIWREAFADKLREQGIEANATRRRDRGVSKKAKSGAEWHIDKKFKGGKLYKDGTPYKPSKAQAARFAEATRELREGTVKPKLWEAAMQARRRDVLRAYKADADRLRAEGDVELAAKVERFAAEMPPLTTERHEMQRAIKDQVQERLRAQQTKDLGGPVSP